MKIPNDQCKIEMSCPVNFSEDPEKIKIAILNIFPFSKIEIKNHSILAKSHELGSFENICETIHSKQLQKIYRRYLEKNLQNNSTWFYLNKQAAFANKVAICEDPEESPLGPVKVMISSDNIDEIIGWIVSGDTKI